MLRQLLARRSSGWPVRRCRTQTASCPALLPFLFAPIFLGLPYHRGSRRVLHLEPVRRVAGAIHRVLALRHDAFESHLAGVGEDGRAVAFHVLVEAQAKASFGQHTPKRGLAHFQRITPHVVAIQLDEVESVAEGVAVMASVTDTVERGNAVIVTGNGVAIDDAGARAQVCQRLDDQRSRRCDRREYRKGLLSGEVPRHSGALLNADGEDQNSAAGLSAVRQEVSLEFFLVRTFW